MTGFDRECVLLTLLKALAPSRIQLFPSWAGLPAMSFPDSVFVLSSTRSAVLALRTGHPPWSACAAGNPLLVTPFAADHFFWADLLHR